MIQDLGIIIENGKYFRTDAASWSTKRGEAYYPGWKCDHNMIVWKGTDSPSGNCDETDGQAVIDHWVNNGGSAADIRDNIKEGK